MDANKELETICSEIFRLLSDDFLLKEVKEKIRTALRFEEDEFERFAQWWSIVSKGEQKAFVHLLVGDGWDWDNACRVAKRVKCTGARCDGDLDEAYENFGRYFARKYGVDKCLNDPINGFDYGIFGLNQENLHCGSAVASAVVGEWLIFDDGIEDCIS